MSIKDGCSSTETYAQNAVDLGGNSLCVTNHGRAGGMARQYFACKAAKIKPIFGQEIYVSNNRLSLDRVRDALDVARKRVKQRVAGAAEKVAELEAYIRERIKPSHHAILIAKNRTGYKNLVRISSDAWLNGYYYAPRTDTKFLASHADGLIYSTACIGGYIPVLARYDFAAACAEAKKLMGAFGPENFYVELMATSYSKQRDTNEIMLRLAHEVGARTIVTCDVHYSKPEDQKAQSVLLLMRDDKTIKDVQAGEGAWQFDSKDLYWKTLEDVIRVWNEHHKDYWPKEDFERAIRNTYELANSIEAFDFDLSLKLPQVFDSPAATLKELVRKGLEDRKARGHIPASGKSMRDYAERVIHELSIINGKNFAEYFLILWDLCRHAREIGARMGPGRGCLKGDVPIVMADGTTQHISTIRVGDVVRSHLGEARRVTATHRYPVEEDLVRLHCFYGAEAGVTLTADHEVWAEKAHQVPGWDNFAASTKKSVRRWENPSGALGWIPAGELAVGDWVFVPVPVVAEKSPGQVDLSHFAEPARGDAWDENYVTGWRRSNEFSRYSVKGVARETGISEDSVRFIRLGVRAKQANSRHERALGLVEAHVTQAFPTLEAWRDHARSAAMVPTRIARYLDLDNPAFLRFLGFWIANGWLLKEKEQESVFGVCFHSEAVEVQEAMAFFKSIGVTPLVRKAAHRKLIQLVVHSRPLTRFWRSLFPNYRSTSQTKDFPAFVHCLPVESLRHVLAGYLACDGSHGPNKVVAFSASVRLAEQLRFLCWRCGIPASFSVSTRVDPRSGKASTAFIVRMTKDERLGGKSAEAAYRWRPVEGGVLLQVRSVEKAQGEREVFDLTVEEDHSYLTSSFAVHNSAGASCVAFLLGITEIDPLRFNLFFERFLDPTRKDAPDVDLDFSPEHREPIKKYLESKYPAVATIGTYSTFKARSTIQAVSRVYGLDRKEVLAITKPLGDVPTAELEKMSLDEVLEHWPEVKGLAEKNPEAWEVIKTLDGLISHRGQHASGVLVGPASALDELPMIRDPKTGAICTEFADTAVQGGGIGYEGREISRLGWIKVDILGQNTLNVAAGALKLIERDLGETIDLSSIPLDDPEALAVASSGDVPGVFQFDTNTSRPLLRTVGVTVFEDLAAITALARPGPLKSRLHERFAKLKRDDSWKQLVPTILHEPLGPSRGLLIFQEDIMRSVMALAGFSMEEANAIRKVIGKKLDPEILEKWRSKFVDGAVARGHDREWLMGMFEILKDFAKYAFAAPHAIAYAREAYDQLYLLAHYPIQYFASLLTTTEKWEKLGERMRAAASRGIAVLPPSVLHSECEFEVEGPAVRYGLSQIKGVANAANAVRELRAQMEEDGVASSLSFEALFASVDRKRCNARALALLILSGACDEIDFEREGLEDLLEDEAQEPLVRRNALLVRLAYLNRKSKTKAFERPTVHVPSVLAAEERKLIGLLLSFWSSREPTLLRESAGLQTIKAELERDAPRLHLLAEVARCHVHKAQGRGDMAFLSLADETGALDNVVLFSSDWKAHKERLRPGKIVAIHLSRKESRDGKYGKWSYSLDDRSSGTPVEALIALRRRLSARV